MAKSHEEKCRKYKQKIENLTIDLEDSKEFIALFEARNEKLKEKIKKLEAEKELI